MITKAKLLEMIDEGIRTEEKAVPLYLKYISTSVSWYGFTEKQRKHIEETLREIAGECEEHKATLASARRAVEEGGRMFTKNDFREYLAQMIEMERSVLALYSNIEEQLDAQELKQVFGDLAVSESTHIERLSELRSLAAE